VITYCLFNERLRSLLVNPGGMRNLADNQPPDILQHGLLAKRQAPLLLEQNQLSQDQRNLKERSRPDPL
jgi:hypothetical protein